jgi:hypothetical protein
MRKDEETERTLRIYSKSSTYEYVPRSKKREDYVVARPVKAPKCVVCGKADPEPFECEFCHELYCEEHLPAEKHDCPGRKGEEMPPEEAAAIKRAIAAKLENIIGRLPAVYMLIDGAGADELVEVLQHLEGLEDVLTKIADREDEE